MLPGVDPRWDLPGWVVCHGAVFRPIEDVFDLRASMKHLARAHGKITHCDYPDTAFMASFSRAARTLLRRGHLSRVGLVPVADKNGEHVRFLALSDGLYFSMNDRQVRFVRCHVDEDIMAKATRPSGA